MEVEFTATEAGKYVLKAADGEENASITVIKGEYEAEMVELPYTFEMEAGATIKFLVCTSAIMTLTEDTIDLVIEVATDDPIDPPASEDPVDPPVDDSSSNEPTTSEPTDDPATSEPTTSEPATSEPEAEK